MVAFTTATTVSSLASAKYPNSILDHGREVQILASCSEAAAEDIPGVQTAVSFNTSLKAAKSLEEAHDVVCKGLLQKLPSVLMREMEDMNVTKSLANYALDSLVAIEVRNYINREFEANLQVLELLSSGSINTFSEDHLLEK